MPQSLIQRSFAGGELSPSMYGRADQTKYQTGLKSCRNFMVLKHGGVANRIGPSFVNEVLDSTVRTYMIKFVFNAEQTYIIEVGEEYFRFFREGARIVVSGVAAYNGATTYALADLVSYLGVNYYSKVAGNLGNQPDISPTQWYPLDGSIYEIPHPYAADDLATLKYVQSGDTVTITHPSYDTRELTRTGHTAWSLQTQNFAPSISAPAGLAATAGAAGSTVYRYKVTAVKSETYEESIASSSAATAAAATPTAADPNTLTWTAVTGAAEYNVYRESSDGSGFYCFIGVAGSNSFSDNNFTVDATVTPPITRNPFSGAGNMPKTCSYYQQRLVLAGSDNAPEKVFTSRTAMFDNFTISSPLQDDDAVTFTIAGRQVNEVRHLVEIGNLVVLTAGGEWVVLGDADGILKANQPPNLKQIGYSGASEVMPVVITNSLLYMQARGSVMKDLRNTVTADGESKYQGRDLTVFSGHLFQKKQIERMDFSQVPNSIVWCIRNDGTMLGLTYMLEHEVWGWHRHDTDGFFEEVCVVPEDDEDILYVIVRRNINGTWKRYIERFPSRYFTDIAVDATFLDSYLTYDGRNTTATTFTLSTAAGWTVDDDITITASAGTFVAGDVGNWFKLDIIDPDTGEITDTVTIDVQTYTDPTHVVGLPSKTVPAALRGVATDDWTRMVDEVSGVSHLEAKDVAVFGDGHVVANPNNSAYTVVTVSAGAITLERPYGVIHVGLPYISDFKTLDIDIAGEQVRGNRKKIQSVDLLVEETRGIWAGSRFPEEIPDDERQDEDDLLEGLNELQPNPITDYGQPWPLMTEKIEIAISSTWDNSGSFVVRQIDPLPATILSAIPSGEMGG